MNGIFNTLIRVHNELTSHTLPIEIGNQIV